MTISAASSEFSLPHKNHRRYLTSATAQSTGTSATTISPAQLPQFIVLWEIESLHHHANFVTFFIVAWCVGNLTFSLLVRCLKDNFTYFINLHRRLMNCVVSFSFGFLHFVLLLENFSRGWLRHNIQIIRWVVCLLQLSFQLVPLLLAFFIIFPICFSIKRGYVSGSGACAFGAAIGSAFLNTVQEKGKKDFVAAENLRTMGQGNNMHSSLPMSELS